MSAAGSSRCWLTVAAGRGLRNVSQAAGNFASMDEETAGLRDTVDDYDAWRADLHALAVRRSRRRQRASALRVWRAVSWFATAAAVAGLPLGGVALWELPAVVAALAMYWHGDRRLCQYIAARSGPDVWAKIAAFDSRRSPGERWPGQYEFRAESEMMLAFCREQIRSGGDLSELVARSELVGGYIVKWFSGEGADGLPHRSSYADPSGGA